MTSIQSHGVVDPKPLQVYGEGETILRIGNGGAGAAGLIEALANDYLKTRPGRIEWVCNHSRNTQLALLEGYIDVALTYERDQEELAASEGWSITHGCAFHDHFCLVGPVSDPAGIRSSKDLLEAFRKIALHKAPFHNRADASATMWKERSLWNACGLAPWEDNSSTWYKSSICTPSEALIQADKEGAYLLSDRSTVLRQTSLGTVSNSTVFYEPTSPSDVLMNSCYALYSTNVSGDKLREIQSFLDYLRSDRGQKVVASFGDDAKFPLFASISEGFAKTSLVGGRPVNGVWKKGNSTVNLVRAKL